MQHELISNLAVGVDFIYRKYDRGTANYAIGYQPGGPLGSAVEPLRQGRAAVYRSGDRQERAVLRHLRRVRASVGLGNITVTNPNWQIYKGRRPHRHQAVQQPVADADGADDADQPELLPGQLAELHQPDRSRVPGRPAASSAATSTRRWAATSSPGTSPRRPTSTGSTAPPGIRRPRRARPTTGPSTAPAPSTAV